MRAVDVHGFGGGFTLGAAQAGFELVAKKSRFVGFGVLNTLANRDLLGYGWESQAEDPEHWTLERDVDMVFGNPPCSGFSTLSRADFRGVDAKINDCMWELVTYAGRVSPRIVIFESVQQAFSQGLSLMRDLRAKLEQMTGHEYTLYHVLHNNASVGGASVRKRYYWVASREPFGVEDSATRWDFRTDQLVEYELDQVPSLQDAIGDLEPLGTTMVPQMYPNTSDETRGWDDPNEYEWDDSDIKETELMIGWRNVNSSKWAREHAHDGTGIVDGHDVIRPPMLKRIEELCRTTNGDGGSIWREGERMSQVLRRYWETYGELPRSWRYVTHKRNGDQKVNLLKSDRLVETDFAMGHSQPVRWPRWRPANVVTGGAAHAVVHYQQPRTLTHREVARIQGFPDAWKIFPVRDAADLGPGWGKGVPVHTGRWVAHCAMRSLEGDPGSIRGEEMGDRERKINLTNSYKGKLPNRVDDDRS